MPGAMKVFLLQQFKAHRAILINVGSLVSSTLVTSGLGFVYWWIATWRFPAELVGLGFAAILAMTLLGTFCLFGLGTLLVSELPRQPGTANGPASMLVHVVPRSNAYTAHPPE